MDCWYVLFVDDEHPKWASTPSRAHAINAARRFLSDGVTVTEIGPLNPGSEGEPINGRALRELCRTFSW
jgi:hypothetical protein